MVGVKDFILEFKTPFDRTAKAKKKATSIIKDRGEKPTKELLEEEISNVLAEWEHKRQRGERFQQKLCEKEANTPNVIIGEYTKLEEIESIDNSICKLENNKTYLEKLLFSKKHKIIGYADRIDVSRGTINITDNKVVSKIYRSGSFKTKDGFKIQGVKMQAPLENLDETNYNDFCLQLSLYMYLAWENNKHLKIGKLFIRHITMNDNDKVTSDNLIEVPYMKEEVVKMLKYKKLNED